MSKNKLPIPKVPVPGANSVNPVMATASAFSMLLDAYKDYNQIKQTEHTKREVIRAQRDVALSRIQAQKDIIQTYLQNSFSERAENFKNCFDILDKGLEAGNDKTIAMAMSIIVKQIETNPLEGINQLMSANVMEQIENQDVDYIDI